MAKKSPTEFKINLEGFTPIQREAIAIEVIDKIRERTDSGIDRNGRKFKAYSQKYVNSQDFKIAGKSKGKIDLKLSGDMLDSMEIIKNRAGEVVIGYGKGNPEQGKAEGNILGTYGNDSPVTKGRDFLGLPESEIRNILKKYKKNPDKRAEKILSEVESAEILSGNVDVEDLLDDES